MWLSSPWHKPALARKQSQLGLVRGCTWHSAIAHGQLSKHPANDQESWDDSASGCSGPILRLTELNVILPSTHTMLSVSLALILANLCRSAPDSMSHLSSILTLLVNLGLFVDILFYTCDFWS